MSNFPSGLSPADRLVREKGETQTYHRKETVYQPDGVPISRLTSIGTGTVKDVTEPDGEGALFHLDRDGVFLLGRSVLRPQMRACLLDRQLVSRSMRARQAAGLMVNSEKR